MQLPFNFQVFRFIFQHIIQKGKQLLKITPLKREVLDFWIRKAPRSLKMLRIPKLINVDAEFDK